MITKTVGRVTKQNHPFSPATSRPGIASVTEQFEEATIVDVIVNNEHPEYCADGYNVGSIKFRFLSSNFFRPDETLNWAFPLDANISEYPLLSEIVYVFKALNRFYYFKKFNVANRPTSQPLFGVNEESQPVKTSSDNLASFKAASSSPVKNNTSVNTQLGAYFTENSKVFRLKHLEGDVIFEGRSGQSIRFGTSWLDGDSGNVLKKPFRSTKVDQSPNILLRVGPDAEAQQTVKSPFGLVIEDINKDASSIWMTTDQIIDLKTVTRSSKIEGISIDKFPSLSGNQIIVNTDRFVINTKNDKILGFSNTGIHWTTLQDITQDADRDHITWTNRNRLDRVAGQWKTTIGNGLDQSVTGDTIQLTSENYNIGFGGRFSLVGPRIFIGTTNSTAEPLVLGMTLRDCLEQLLQTLALAPLVLQTSAPGAPSLENPARIAKFQQILAQFISGGATAKILSQNNFTSRTNDTPTKPRTIQNYKES